MHRLAVRALTAIMMLVGLAVGFVVGLSLRDAQRLQNEPEPHQRMRP